MYHIIILGCVLNNMYSRREQIKAYYASFKGSHLGNVSLPPDYAQS